MPPVEISEEKVEVTEDHFEAKDSLYEMFEGAEFRDQIGAGFSQLDPKVQDLFGGLDEIEDVQKVRYVREVLETVEWNISEEFQAENLKEEASTFVATHRASRGVSTSHCFQAGIVGPPASGKTTFLGILAEQILVSLVASDSWKRTFIFAADVAKLISPSGDLAAEYQLLIRHIFALFKAQLPIMMRYFRKIEAGFIEIVDSQTKPGSVFLPRILTQNHSLKSLADDLQAIGQRLIDAWFDPEAFDEWIATLTTLPLTLSRAFGFRDVIFVLDHFDSLSTCLYPSYPFEDSPDAVFLTESWKSAMQTASFLVAAKESTPFFEAFEPTDELGTNCGSVIEYLTLLGTEPPEYGDLVILVEFAGDREQFRLTSDYCGGIPAYNARWASVHKQFDAIESLDHQSDEYAEEHCLVIAAVQALIAILFTGSPVPTIEDVYRH
jgi:hypothetical protein